MFVVVHIPPKRNKKYSGNPKTGQIPILNGRFLSGYQMVQFSNELAFEIRMIRPDFEW
jgi:hypothetical protein